MAACGRCGRAIRWGRYQGERISLDTVPDLRKPASTGALYRLDPHGGEEVELIPPQRNDLAGYTDHRDTCTARS